VNTTNSVSDEYAGVRLERRGHLLIVAMDRPHKRNAVNAVMAAALDAAFDRLDDDPHIWVGILTGSSDVFSAGNDLVSGSGSPTARGGQYGLITRDRRKPLIAAVEGFALGGGLEMVLACDLVVAGETAQFGLPEVTRGVIPLYGGLFRLARALPLNVAREMVLTGESIGAARAYDLGLVNHVAASGHALDRALVLAERLCRNAPSAVGHALQAFNSLVGNDDETGWAKTAAAKEAVWASADMQEGIRAFRDRRSPRWTGR
jgi:enoyl-CoA hydratase/carnithine racemase